jgi:hypothetical protein
MVRKQHIADQIALQLNPIIELTDDLDGDINSV